MTPERQFEAVTTPSIANALSRTVLGELLAKAIFDETVQAEVLERIVSAGSMAIFIDKCLSSGEGSELRAFAPLGMEFFEPKESVRGYDDTFFVDVTPNDAEGLLQILPEDVLATACYTRKPSENSPPKTI